MDKFRRQIVAQVVVSKKRILAHSMRQYVPLFLKWLLVQMVPHPNSSRDDKVHFSNFLFLVIDNIFLKFITEMSRCQSECNIVQKLSADVLLGVEENPEIEENVVE